MGRIIHFCHIVFCCCVTAGVPKNWFSRVRKYVTDSYQELLSDLTEEAVKVEGQDPDGDQLAVKQ